MKPWLGTLVGCALLSMAGAAAADNWSRRPLPDPALRMMLARGYSLDEAVSGVRRRNSGRVLSADTVQQDGRPVHRIRILNDEGRVRGLRFDGNTGKPLNRLPAEQRRSRRR